MANKEEQEEKIETKKTSKDKNKEDEKKEDEKEEAPLDNDDIKLLMKYGRGPYFERCKKVEEELKEYTEKIIKLCGIKESDTGLALPSQWSLEQDKQLIKEKPLIVARWTKIINPGTEEAQYLIHIRQMAKYVVGLGEKVAPTDVEEGMRVGVEDDKYRIQLPLPPKIDASVTMMTVEEKPDVTYNDVGGAKEQIEKKLEK